MACHSTEAFVGASPPGPGGANTAATNNGLDLQSTTDFGVFESSNNPAIVANLNPSLVNIAVRPPYMHDGRFADLDEVIRHQRSNGVQNHATLSPPLRGRNGQAGNFNFTPEEQAALKAFLETLTDHNMLQAENTQIPSCL